MKQFLDKDFLLSTDMAKTIYHDYAENMPILDYHCHINPQEIYEDRKFENITQVWLGGDHYKWRQMRSNGVDEKYITGDGTDREKFQAWAETMPKLIGNPLYHWSHLELRRYFGYEGYLNGDTAEEVWNLCNEKLKTMSARQLILDSNVEMIGTTDDPIDDLHWHKMIAADETFNVKGLPFLPLTFTEDLQIAYLIILVVFAPVEPEHKRVFLAGFQDDIRANGAPVVLPIAQLPCFRGFAVKARYLCNGCNAGGDCCVHAPLIRAKEN